MENKSEFLIKKITKNTNKYNESKKENNKSLSYLTLASMSSFISFANIIQNGGSNLEILSFLASSGLTLLMVKNFKETYEDIKSREYNLIQNYKEVINNYDIEVVNYIKDNLNVKNLGEFDDSAQFIKDYYTHGLDHKTK